MAGLRAAIAYLVAWDGGQMCEDASTGLQALLGSPLFGTPPKGAKNVEERIEP
jgi:hypothetical protein